MSQTNVTIYNLLKFIETDEGKQKFYSAIPTCKVTPDSLVKTLKLFDSDVYRLDFVRKFYNNIQEEVDYALVFKTFTETGSALAAAEAMFSNKPPMLPQVIGFCDLFGEHVKDYVNVCKTHCTLNVHPSQVPDTAKSYLGDRVKDNAPIIRGNTCGGIRITIGK